jgi:hypothetical protein
VFQGVFRISACPELVFFPVEQILSVRLWSRDWNRYIPFRAKTVNGTIFGMVLLCADVAHSGRKLLDGEAWVWSFSRKKLDSNRVRFGQSVTSQSSPTLSYRPTTLMSPYQPHASTRLFITMAPPTSQALLQPSCSRTFASQDPTIQIVKASAASLSAYCPVVGHIKVGSTESRSWAAKQLNMGSSIVAAGRTVHFKAVSLTRARPVLQQFLACPSRPLSNSVTKLARLRRRAVRAVASEEERRLPSQESANGSRAGSQRLTGRSQPIDVKPAWPADDVQPGRQVKTCTKCQYSKLLLDFQETKVTVDKRQDVCRACKASISSMWKCRELHHLELTPAKAWSRAKTCSKCGIVKEIRDFGQNGRQKDGTHSWCRSCVSMFDRTRPAHLPVDTPQRCSRCHELKPARGFRPSPKAANGLSQTCKGCELIINRERNERRKELPMQLKAIKGLHHVWQA